MTSRSQTFFSATAAVACVASLVVGRATAPAVAVSAPSFSLPAAPAPPQQSADISALDLAYFNTQEFKRRFATSFLSVSDVEPKVSPEEAIELQEIIELIQQDGKREKALSKLKSAITPTSSANYSYLIGQLHFEAKRYDEALAAYEVAVDEDHAPNFRRAWQQIALLHYQRAVAPENESPEADYRSAARSFAKAISLGQVDEISYGMMAASLLNAGKVLSAETAFRQAMMMDPDDNQWRMGLAQCLFKGKRYADAVTLLDEMIAEKPEDVSLWMLQGNAFIGMEKPSLAARNFQVVDQLGGGTNASTNILADIYVNDGLSSNAVDLYLKALGMGESVTPDRGIRAAKLLTGRGEIEEAKRLLDGTEKHFGEDLAQESRTALLKLRAKIAVREGRGDEEIQVLRQIVNQDPLDGDGVILLAQALARSGELDEAIQSFETAASIEGFEAEAKLKHAQVLVREKRFAEAVPLIKASLQIRDKATVRDYLENVEKAARSAVK